MSKLRADLHIHTYYSDGQQSPASVAEAAKQLNLISVTDHDTMLACDNMRALCAEAGIKFVNGAEISAYDGDVKMHTLAYGVNEEKFAPFLKTLYENSFARAQAVIEGLYKKGVKISLGEAAGQRFSDSCPIHSMHISRAGAQKGYASDAGEFYLKYLAGDKTGNSFRPSPYSTCEAIRAAGGIPVLAHPGRISMESERLKKTVFKLKDCGLGGIEVYYTTHTISQTAYYNKLAKELSLFVTGGSDTHFAGGRNRIGQPAFFPSDELLRELGIDF